MGEHHPKDERPRKDAEVVGTSVSAEAEAVTRPIVGKDYPQRFGEITTRVQITVECLCGDDVTAYSVQSKVNCQGCGREWRLLD